MKHTLEQNIERGTPSLSEKEKQVLWKKINSATRPVPSPFSITSLTKNSMIPLALAFLLIFGAGGTALASESARPGDLLFPVDQALESVRLALETNDEARAKIRLRIAEERIEELRSLLSSQTGVSTNSSATSTAATSTTATSTPAATSTPSIVFQLEAEANVYTDLTIVKVEINNRKSFFAMSATTTRDAVITEITNRFNVTTAQVDAVLDFEVENRASRPTERARLTGNGRVDTSLTLIERLLADLSEEERERIQEEISEEFLEDARIRIDDDRIRIQSDEGKLEIREKNGELRIKLDTKDKDDSSRDNDGRDEDRSDDDDSNGRLKIEARAEDGTVKVEIEGQGNDSEFKTTFDSRDALVAEIATRTGLSTTTVSAALDLEIKR